MVRKVSKELEQEIVRRYTTCTSTELSKEYNIKQSTIKGIWRRNNCTGKNKIPFSKQDFINYYKEHTIMETAQYYNVDRHTVTKYAKKYGIYEPKEPLLTEKQKQEIIESYNSCTSIELGKKYHVSSSKIAQVWSQANLYGKPSRVYHLNENYFENIETDEQAYWVGFLAADGCIYRHKDNRQDIIAITLKIGDIDHLKKFAKAVATDKPISTGKNANNEFYHCSIQISSNKMSYDLQKIGILPKKTYHPIMPNIPDKLFPAFLRGYFDGDGAISTNFTINTLHKVTINIVGFKPLIPTMQEKISQYGIDMGITVYDTSKYTRPGFCCIYCRNKMDKNNFLHLIYDNASVYLDRKYNLAQRYIELFNQNPTTWKTRK